MYIACGAPVCIPNWVQYPAALRRARTRFGIKNRRSRSEKIAVIPRGSAVGIGDSFIFGDEGPSSDPALLLPIQPRQLSIRGRVGIDGRLFGLVEPVKVAYISTPSLTA